MKYAYHCNDCGDIISHEKMSEPRLTKCPICGGPIKRVFTVPNIRFKGPGFTKSAKETE